MLFGFTYDMSIRDLLNLKEDNLHCIGIFKQHSIQHKHKLHYTNYTRKNLIDFGASQSKQFNTWHFNIHLAHLIWYTHLHCNILVEL